MKSKSLIDYSRRLPFELSENEEFRNRDYEQSAPIQKTPEKVNKKKKIKFVCQYLKSIFFFYLG
jgi:hypothetical protein